MKRTTRHKSKGAVDTISGGIKRAVGRTIGNSRMEAEGTAQAARGKARHQGARLVERAKGKAQQVAGGIEKRVGRATKNERMTARGRGREIAGENRRARSH
jgi:uncharacterized protein YjbJ (UPF0337 family)